MSDESPHDEPVEEPGSKKRRGRPPGSVSLTDEMAQKILAYVRAGAFAYEAAEAAGISDRTLRDWIERVEGEHPTRPATPKLVAFVTALRQARAEARIGAEMRVYRDHPRYWLAHAARWKPGREGWTAPPAGAEEADGADTLESRIRELDERDQANGSPPPSD